MTIVKSFARILNNHEKYQNKGTSAIDIIKNKKSEKGDIAKISPFCELSARSFEWQYGVVVSKIVAFGCTAQSGRQNH